MRRVRRFLVIISAAIILAAAVPAAVSAAESYRVTGVSFVDAAHGYIAGGRIDVGGGFASYTDDGGATWRHGTLPLWLSGVSAQNASAATVIGSFSSIAYSTGNAGLAWAPSGPMVPGVGALNMLDVARTASGALVAVGQHIGAAEGDLATIWRSVDGGATWSKRFDGPVQPAPNEETDPPSTIANLTRVGFAADGLHGWAAGSEWNVVGSDTGFVTFKQVLVYKTSDGGSTWTTQTVPTAGQQIATSLSVVDANTAWVGCSNGAVYRTIDGSTWAGPFFAPFGALLGGRFSVGAIDGLTAVVVGQQGQISKTTDGGLSWSPVLRPTAQHLYSVEMVDASVGYVGGNNVLLRTADGGLTWQPLAPITTTALTLAATPTRVPSGRPTALSGALTTAAGAGLSGKSVTLQYSPDGTTWNANGSTVTGAGGTFTFAANPTAKTYYRVQYAGEFGFDPSTSANATVEMDTPPTTTASGIPPTGWSLADLTVTLSVSDDLPGYVTYFRRRGLARVLVGRQRRAGRDSAQVRDRAHRQEPSDCARQAGLLERSADLGDARLGRVLRRWLGCRALRHLRRSGEGHVRRCADDFSQRHGPGCGLDAHL
jgi:photosystem II stability/assembly factor-like uncharacterized protein